MSSIDVLIYAVAVVILTPVAFVLLFGLLLIALFVIAVLLSTMSWMKEKIYKLFKDIKMIMGNK